MSNRQTDDLIAAALQPELPAVNSGKMTRRQVLRTVGGLAVGGLLAACSSGASSTAGDVATVADSVSMLDSNAQQDFTGPSLDTTVPADTELTPPDGTSPGTDATSDATPSADQLGGDTSNAPDVVANCSVYPKQMEGPFYLDLDMLRSDITEGRSGTALELTLTVLKSDGCTPLVSKAVDIWHCDAGGLYSGYPQQVGGVDTSGQKFLRGTQVTDNAGRVTFTAIYPGWYPGRTTHIHFKIHPTANTEAISQLYFPEATTTEVYKVAPYNARGPKDTSNNGDFIFAADPTPLVAISEANGGYAASITVTVQG